DRLVINAKIYSCNDKNQIFSSMAIRDGKIAGIGTDQEITDHFIAGVVEDAGGKAVFPGFIDAHCHFIGYADYLRQADLRGTRSFDEVLKNVEAWSRETPDDWILGRGWDHNTWVGKVFPDRTKLDEMFPSRPVVLVRVDGHVLLANGEALRRAGIHPENFQPGEVEVKNGTMTGILGENAADKMRESVPAADKEVMTQLILRAEKNCFAAGLTTVNDAGSDKKTILFTDSLQKSGILKIRMTMMLNPSEENFDYFMKKGVYKTGRLSVTSVKIYADGSLGSRSALLKHPYSDDPGKFGITTTPAGRIRQICDLAYRYNYQVNTHAIGDSAVSLVLHIYGEFLKGKNDRRWRIEHAQVVDPADISLFGKFSIIPSVQATHATSDMYWAPDRLGKERVRWAYAYKDLMNQNGWIPDGTDFPIENINPLLTFYAAVSRKDVKGYPEGGFQKENALTREEALKSITIWAAKASFDEDTRGSLEKVKFADFVILDKDIMTTPENEIPGVKVLGTFLNGELVSFKMGAPLEK
ncbi:MAG: amidohydrolase, partial [Syntrophothermus sp.]